MVDGYVGTVETERLGDSLWVLKLAGEHDLSTAAAIDDALRRIAECGTTVVVDLAQTSFIDSTVIGALVRHADRDETLLLVAPAAGRPRKVLDLVGMTSRMQAFETRDEALRARPRIGCRQRSGRSVVVVLLVPTPQGVAVPPVTCRSRLSRAAG